MHRLYGLRVASPWPLPGPRLPRKGACDIELFAGSAALFRKVPAVEPEAGKWFHYKEMGDGSFYLWWQELFDFLVSRDGRRIACRPLARASREVFQTYLLAQVLGFSLLKQGREPLHATTVAVDGKAVAFLGDCGYGKSTLAAEFLRAGGRLLTDDVLVVKRSGKKLLAFPGPARLKLFPHVAKGVLGTRVNGVPMNPLTAKIILPLGADQAQSGPAPLRAMYVIAPEWKGRPRSRISIRAISQKNAALELLRNTFNTMVVEPERLERQLQHAARVAAAVPIRRLSYPRKLSALPAVRERILADLSRNGR